MQAVLFERPVGVLVCVRTRKPSISQALTIRAGWFLITTDILGPYSVGFALGTLGWGPGEPGENKQSSRYCSID